MKLGLDDKVYQISLTKKRSFKHTKKRKDFVGGYVSYVKNLVQENLVLNDCFIISIFVDN